MKQPRSSSHTSTRLSKKPLLPSFKQSKTTSKVQQLVSNNKTQIYFNIKIIPIEVFAEKKNGENVKVIVNYGDIVIQDGGRIFKAGLNLGSSTDVNQGKAWVQLNFGEVFNNVRIKKIGDENVFGGSSTMVSWDNLQHSQKKVTTIINIKQIIKSQQKSIQNPILASLPIKEDKSRQMKAFVANLMSKKVHRRSSQANEIQPKFSLKKKSQIFKSKIIGCDQVINQQCNTAKLQPPSTATSILSGLSGVKSFRHQIINGKNLLKESKFTQKQTSIGDQSLFLNHKTNANLTQLSSLESQNYDKQKNKFDSQPYFYQKSTLTSHVTKDNQSTKKIEYSRQQKSQTKINKTVNIEDKIMKDKNLGECFQNKSQHQSQQQVEEDIKRSQMINSSLKNSEEQQFRDKKKVQKCQQSSQCVESKQLESSGTIYQSKYQ